MGQTKPAVIEEKKVDDYLNEVDYSNQGDYIPGDFALEFINFIKLVNGEQGEENLTPVLHYKILDQIPNKKSSIANMIFRGSGKTALLAEYLFLYLAVYGDIPGFGKVDYALYISDSIENGVKKLRLRLEGRIEKSEFLRSFIKATRFTDIRWYFKNADGNEFVVTGHGVKALALSSVLYTENGKTTIKDCKIGQRIYGPDGRLAKILAKSEIFNKPMYRLELEDKRVLDVSEDHINSVLKYGKPKNLLTSELLKASLFRIKANGTKSYTFHIENTKPLEYSNKEFLVDPYTLGLLLGNGSIKRNGSVVLHLMKEDIDFCKKYIPYELGFKYLDKRNDTVINLSIKGLNQYMRNLGISKKTAKDKRIPEEYFYGSIQQKQKLLQGLMDTNGTVTDKGKVSYCSASKQLCVDVMRLVRSLGGTAKFCKEVNINKREYYKIRIWLNMACCFLPRKTKREKFNKSNKVAIVAIHRIEDSLSQCIAVDNEDHQFLANDYVRTHNTGVRGTTELNTRPKLAVMDDLLSDEDARSDTVIKSIENVVYKAVDYALHPRRYKKIWSGTPFNSKDPLYKAIESGAWQVNVFPVCEQYPCTKDEFRGAWEDRFSYEYVKEKYDMALKLGEIESFNQELMLRIMSEEDRLILDSDIQWYSRKSVLENKGLFNFYITTDFATSEKNSSDFSVISVWAYNNVGDWLWVDGICKKQTMDKNIDDLFRFAQTYMPQQTGIEITGQQKGFVSWIQTEMLNRNIFFALASENNENNPGIRPNTNKMVRFNIVVPWFKQHKIYFPQELKDHPAIKEALNELSLVSITKFKSKHDDFIDTISMLASLKTWKPSQTGVMQQSRTDDHLWEIETEDEICYLDSYVV